MNLALIMQFRPLILLICFIIALVGLKTILSFFPKKMKHAWIKLVVIVIYGYTTLSVLDTQIYETDSIPLGKTELGVFFEKEEVSWACPNKEQMAHLNFYDLETRTDITFNPCFADISISVVDDEKFAGLEYRQSYSLLRGQLFGKEGKEVYTLYLPEEAAKELSEIWGVPIF